MLNSYLCLHICWFFIFVSAYLLVFLFIAVYKKLYLLFLKYILVWPLHDGVCNKLFLNFHKRCLSQNYFSWKAQTLFGPLKKRKKVKRKSSCWCMVSALHFMSQSLWWKCSKSREKMTIAFHPWKALRTLAIPVDRVQLLEWQVPLHLHETRVRTCVGKWLHTLPSPPKTEVDLSIFLFFLAEDHNLWETTTVTTHTGNTTKQRTNKSPGCQVCQQDDTLLFFFRWGEGAGEGGDSCASHLTAALNPVVN